MLCPCWQGDPTAVNPVLHAVADEIGHDIGSMFGIELCTEDLHCLFSLVASVFTGTLDYMIGVFPKLVAFETSSIVFIIKCL